MAGPEQAEVFSVIRPTLTAGGEGLVSRVTLAGYGSVATGDDSPPFTLQKGLQRPGQNKQAPAHRVIRPETRAALRACWKDAVDAASEMIRAAECGDERGLVIAADDLDAALAKLWELKAARDIDWLTILNHAQGMLKQAFAQARVERLTPDQCRCIKKIVDRYLGPATKTIADLTEVIRLIEDAGFDPYFAISGDPDE